MDVRKIDWNSVSLGEKPDHLIAYQLGCRTALVGDQRRKRGFPLPKKEPQTFKLGNVATDEQMAQYYKQWKSYPLTTEYPCRQCSEDFYLTRTGDYRALKITVRRDTDQGVYCLRHYAALPVCGCCACAFTHREGELCEICCQIRDGAL